MEGEGKKPESDTSVVISAAPEVVEEEAPVISVGDYIEFETGPYVGLKGMIYYLDEEVMYILPLGLSDSLKEVPTTIFEDESTSIKLEPTALSTFIEIAELKEGQDVQTFDKLGQPAGVYHITSVNLQDDTAVLTEKETGDRLDLEFTEGGVLRGLNRDLPFQVLRAQEAEKAGEPEADAAPAAETEEEEINLTMVIDEPEDEEDESLEMTFRERPPEEVVYADEEQKNHFLEMERAALKPEKRSNPKVLKRIRRLMESCLQLRNEILDYKDSGRIELKPVVYETLAKLLSETDFPLAKQVLAVAKSVYLDHSVNSFLKNEVDPANARTTAIDLHYLDEALQAGIEFLETQFKADPNNETRDPRQLPKLYETFQLYFNDYYRTMKPLASEIKETIKKDRDFFRLNPDSLTKTALPGLDHVGDDEVVVGADSLRTISLSYMRAIKSRIGRFGDRKLRIQGQIEEGDQAEILYYILFPFEFLRDMGAIRSGKLSLDIGNGMGNPKTIKMILDEKGGIQTLAKAGDILAVDPAGETTGNIELEDWLKGQALYGNGLGDLLPYLKSLGLDTAEFTPEQQAVLLKKIQFYQANLKKFLSESRKRANEVLSNPQPVLNNTLLEGDAVESFLTILHRNEQILTAALSNFKVEHPSWQANDIAAFAYLFVRYPDFLLASLGNGADVALERKRVIDDSFLKTLYQSIELKKKEQATGQEPIVNECDHVKNLEAIRKIQDDDQRIQVIVRELLPMFQGQTKDHWIECKVCQQHLMCEHEFLMIREKTHPNQKDVIHKSILLTYSDGVFNGKFICGNCGQPIQDLEFDQSLEFDDEGRPMIGNEPLTEEVEETLAKEIENLLETRTNPYTQVSREKSKDQTPRLLLLDEIAKKVGLYLPDQSISRLLAMIDRVIENRDYKKIDDYNKAVSEQQAALKAQGKKASEYPTYLEYVTQYTISACAAAVFLEIQCAVPEYALRGFAKNCGDPTFQGYPLSKNPDQIEGLSYMACAVASLLRAESPWSDTFWARRVDQKKHAERILQQLKAQVDRMQKQAEVTTMIEKKRAFLEKEQGALTLEGRYAEQIPSDFLPSSVSREEIQKEKDPTIAQAAAPAQKAYAWLLEGYALARQHGVYEPGNPLSEASCCYSSVFTPQSFWKEQGLVNLGSKQPPRGPRGSLLALKMVPRKAEALLAEPDPKLMYRLFLKVCFDGPRKGLAHEPGYDNTCPYCKFEFPVDPRLPPPQLSYAKDKGVQKKYDEEYKTEVQELYQKEIGALRSAGVVEGDSVERRTFEDLLQAVNDHYIIPPLPIKTVTTNLDTIDELLELNPEPFVGYKATMQTVRKELFELAQKLRSGEEVKSNEIALAYSEISERAREFDMNLQTQLPYRLGKETVSKLQAEWSVLTKAPCQTLGEILRTFFLLPFQRLQKNFSPTPITLKGREAVYSLIGDDDRKKIDAFMNSHWNTTNSIQKEIDKAGEDIRDRLLQKIDQFIGRLTVAIPLFIKVLRSNVIPFGSVGLPYIQAAIFKGIVWEFLDPSAIGGKVTLRNCFVYCMLKAQEKDENVIKSPDEIRKLITSRNESEKMEIINEFDRMNPEQKRAELTMKKLGLGRWARGASKGIFAYDEEHQAFEAAERARRGITDFYIGGADTLGEGEGYDTYAADGDE